MFFKVKIQHVPDVIFRQLLLMVFWPFLVEPHRLLIKAISRLLFNKGIAAVHKFFYINNNVKILLTLH